MLGGSEDGSEIEAGTVSTLLQKREDRRATEPVWLQVEVQRGLDSGPAEPIDWDNLAIASANMPSR